MKVLVFGLVVILFLLAACGPAVVCSPPYILKGRECCLDNDANKVCDVDQDAASAARGDDAAGAASAAGVSCSKLDCSACPARVEVQKEEVIKYVCVKTGQQVADPALCNVAVTNAFTGYSPVTTNQNRTILQEVSVRPACRNGKHALELFFKVGSAYDTFVLEYKESPDGEWRRVYEQDDAILSRYSYVIFCEGPGCALAGKYLLPPGKVYLFRGRFDYRKLYGDFFYTNEYLVDTTPEGAYMTKLC